MLEEYASELCKLTRNQSNPLRVAADSIAAAQTAVAGAAAKDT